MLGPVGNVGKELCTVALLLAHNHCRPLSTIVVRFVVVFWFFIYILFIAWVQLIFLCNAVAFKRVHLLCAHCAQSLILISFAGR